MGYPPAVKAAIAPQNASTGQTGKVKPAPSGQTLEFVIPLPQRDRQPTAKTVDAVTRAVREAKDPDIHTITRQGIIALRDGWIAAGNSVATTNKKIGFVRRMLGIAKGRGLIEGNPAEGEELPPPKQAVELRRAGLRGVWSRGWPTAKPADSGYRTAFCETANATGVRQVKFEAFAYLNIDHPVTAWATALGRIESADQTARATGQRPLSLCMASMLHSEDYVRLQNEWLIEAIRVECFPNAVSRLTGLFVFDDAESALAVLSADWGGHFSDDYLADLDVTPSRPPTRLDSNWITYAPLVRKTGALDTRDLNWIKHYWAGEKYPHAPTPVWEVLVDGIATIRQSALTEQAYSRAMQAFPESEFYLLTGRMAARAGENAGQVCAWMLEHSDALEVCFALNEGPLHYSETIKRLIDVATAAEIQRLHQTPEQFRLPDLCHLFVFLSKTLPKN
ncbi:hypothetical protein ACIP1U_09050 [Cupriavidus sp. NPDC089707]|uniref:hypothetical protein n=1 Tax=Cupriavidus sp. NPDC089707 TaxID=3363963 RepID=UPI00380EB622